MTRWAGAGAVQLSADVSCATASSRWLDSSCHGAYQAYDFFFDTGQMIIFRDTANTYRYFYHDDI